MTSLMMPQTRCFAPSMRPPIEPVVSMTKTISSVFWPSVAAGVGGCGCPEAGMRASAKAMPTPRTKVKSAVGVLKKMRLILVFLSSFHSRRAREAVAFCGLNGGHGRVLQKKTSGRQEQEADGSTGGRGGGGGGGGGVYCGWGRLSAHPQRG